MITVGLGALGVWAWAGAWTTAHDQLIVGDLAACAPRCFASRMKPTLVDYSLHAL